MRRNLIIIDDFGKKGEMMRKVIIAFAISPDGKEITVYPEAREEIGGVQAKEWFLLQLKLGNRVKRLTISEFEE
ncbi:MAG: hypothetical protein E6Q97_06575 [Desulfurellales bacterium]|nr:MAG: hypothetical protein E6Q97_06575 [Desulfurellales bacterium]